VTYTVGTSPCVATESHDLQVVTNAVAIWTAPAALCQNSSSINLNSLLSGTSTTGGTWSGTGVSGNMFNPAESHDLQVVTNAVATWTAPAALCQNSSSINLNSLLSGTSTTGGIWSGTGVTGNMFNPAGLSGTVTVTYTVGTSPCVATESHDIQVVTNAVATWTAPSALCQNSSSINLNTLLSGTSTAGGVWSGTGVTGNMFNPAGLSGNISVAYTVGTSPCVATESHDIEVIAASTPTISGSSSVNAGSTVTLTGTPSGGSWTSETLSVATVDATSGLVSGVSSGTSLITYTVGCGSASVTVTVNALSASLSVTPTTLTGFTYVVGSGPSVEQVYHISGSNLDGSDVTITPPINYEISLTTGTGFLSTPLVLTAFNGTSTAVYARLKSGLSVGNYNSEIITNTGGGAAVVNVTCSGNVSEDVSISEHPNLLLSIYPNPANGWIIVSNIPSTVKEIKLFDVTGDLVLVTGVNNRKALEVDLTALPNGVYFIYIVDEKNSTTTHKIVKM